MTTPHPSAAKAASASKAPPQNTPPPPPPTKEIAAEIVVENQIETGPTDPPTAPPATDTVTEHTPAIARARAAAPHPPLNPSNYDPLDGEAAFRESLFDALGDDEGAAYWESVYGQPIHNYAVPEIPKGPDGELERMDEEEYATYVRAQMWTRTREGMMAEQDRLRAERRKAKIREEGQQRQRGRDAERDAFERAMEDSLRRGQERRKGKAWVGVWGRYLEGWEGVQKAVLQCQDPSTAAADGGDGEEKSGGSTAATPLRNLLFWPVESGKRCDVTPAAVEEFLKHAPEGNLLSTLKVERVRWHPDKIQHRYGVLGVDEKVMRSVTEVFQIVDRMWNEERERVGKS
ncbi:hypothetical protein N7481_011721 [Penicillium waksmanii]|uniref:uncharacterized protein n=1 Tax=Penicillium waksmanii TaxID=69791 RepID=UPI0025479BEA|nr:uncharacterized protein N7481_011721 [Penicillium waksmanii]KAJ5974511.1 hypothetical protein N7481_011721 [Penicillium waksmanii]